MSIRSTHKNIRSFSCVCSAAQRDQEKPNTNRGNIVPMELLLVNTVQTNMKYIILSMAGVCANLSGPASRQMWTTLRQCAGRRKRRKNVFSFATFIVCVHDVFCMSSIFHSSAIGRNEWSVGCLVCVFLFLSGLPFRLSYDVVRWSQCDWIIAVRQRTCFVSSNAFVNDENGDNSTFENRRQFRSCKLLFFVCSHLHLFILFASRSASISCKTKW